MRAITICMLVALTVTGTTLMAQKPGKAAKPDLLEERGHVKTTIRQVEQPYHTPPSAVAKEVGTLGIKVIGLEPRVREWLSIPDGFGVEVSSVKPRSPAEQAGLKERAIILKIDDQWVSNTYHYKALIRRLGPGHNVKIFVKDFGGVIRLGEDNSQYIRIEEYTVEAMIGTTEGLPLVDPVRPMDWSKPPEKETVRHKGVTFNFRDRMAQAINAEGVIRFQGRDHPTWAKYLSKDEFSDMPEGIGGLTEAFRHSPKHWI